MKRIVYGIFTIIVLAGFLFTSCDCDDGTSNTNGNPPFDPCDPSNPVVLNGETIPESRIMRDTLGCVVGIDLGSMDISSRNCIYGIEIYDSTLEWLILVCNQLTSINLSPLSSCIYLEGLYLMGNQLTSINLSPLATCAKLEALVLWGNQLTSIDLSPLASCANLRGIALDRNQLTSISLYPLWELDSFAEFYIDENFLDSASCAHVCDFIDEHPACWVVTDCDCP